MSKPEELTIIEADGHMVGVLKMPPPHMIFLASKVKSEPEIDSLSTLRRAGGLAALVVRTIDGEEVINERRLPRDITALESLGEMFIMAAYDCFGSYESLSDVFAAVLGAYHGEVPNPT